LKYLSVLICVIYSSVVWQVFIFQPNAFAEEGSLGDAIDCTDVNILYTEDSTLTREERLRLMDKAFFESLNRFELCQKAKEEKAKAEGAGTNGGAGGSEGSGGGTGTDSSVESVAGSTMSGTEIAPENSSAKDTQTAESGALPSSREMENIDEAGSSTGDMKMSNGKIPEDIPPAKNDDALAAQIRYAAENEPDPVKSAQLWNEYRKYKGLAPKK
jgi:hypothetical protein